MKYGIQVCTVMFGLLLLSGCGPTRKEYAINEALLIDQTRMLEDRLYRAHFEIQHLQDENAGLRRRLGEPERKPEAGSPVPFDQRAREDFQLPSGAQHHAAFPSGGPPLPGVDEPYGRPMPQYPHPGGAPQRVARQTDPRASGNATYPVRPGLPR